MSEKSSIVFSGGIFRDLVAFAPKFPRPGETVFGDDFLASFGGKSANQVRPNCLQNADSLIHCNDLQFNCLLIPIFPHYFPSVRCLRKPLLWLLPRLLCRSCGR